MGRWTASVYGKTRHDTGIFSFTRRCDWLSLLLRNCGLRAVRFMLVAKSFSLPPGHHLRNGSLEARPTECPPERSSRAGLRSFGRALFSILLVVSMVELNIQNTLRDESLQGEI